MKKQTIAKLLVLVMVLTMVPVTILAASAATAAGSNSGYYAIYEDTTVRVNDTVDGAIKATVVGGKATVVLNTTAVESLAELESNGEIVLEIKAEGASRLEVTFPAKALTDLAKKTGADLTIKSDVVTITIPNDVLSNEFTGFGSVRISAHANEDSVGFSIQAGGKALKNIKGIKVEF